MATSSISPHAPNGQTTLTQPGGQPSTPLQIQINRINPLRRQIKDFEADLLQRSPEELLRFRDIQISLYSQLEFERQRYADALGADRLREQGAGAVAEAWDIICRGMVY